MKVFKNIPPNAGNQSIHLGFKTIVELGRHIINGREDWMIYDLGLDVEDFIWLDHWAINLREDDVRNWLQFGVSDSDEVKLRYSAAFGTLLLLLAVQSAARGLPQVKDWTLPTKSQFSAESCYSLFVGDDPSPEFLRSVRLAAKRMKIRQGRSSEIKQWVRETITLQIAAPDPPNHSGLSNTSNQSERSDTSDQLEVPIDDIFRKIEAVSGTATVESAAQAILMRAREKGFLRRPWSLTDLCPTEYDYIWLRVWVKSLDENTVNFCLTSNRRFAWSGNEYPIQSAFGLLFFLWISETARRNAVEGCLWKWIPQDVLAPGPRTVLFTQGRPSNALKEALEITARRFKLRHVFGIHGTQQWIETVFLQFGFTRRGMESRLPLWLAGQPPNFAVRQLLDGQTGSGMFRELWETLTNYRRGYVTKENALSQLSGNPWLLPDWTEEILEIAATSVERRREADPAAETHISCLTEPLLNWEPPNAPYFACRLIGLNTLGLSEATYDIEVDGQTRFKIHKQPDGDYQVSGDGEIRFPLSASSGVVRLVGHDGGEVALTEEVELWQSGEEATVFQLSNGRSLADSYPTSMSPKSGYALLLAPDLKLDPEPEIWKKFPSAKIFYLAPGWDSRISAMLGEYVLWQPRLHQTASNTQPAWVNQINIWIEAQQGSHDLYRWGHRVFLMVKHPADMEIKFARHRGVPLNIQQMSKDSARVGPLLIGTDIDDDRLQITLGVKWQNNIRTIKKEIIVEVVGAAKLNAAGWNPVHEKSELEAETARTAQIKIKPPARWDGREKNVSDWAVMEGDQWIKSLSPNQTKIGELAGLGAPLTVRLGPYKADRDVVTVAQAVIDHGVLDKVSLDNGELQLHLTRELDPSKGYSITLWDVDGRIYETAPAPEKNHRLWHCPLSGRTTDFIATGISFEGWRLGSCWQSNWSSRVKSVAGIDPLKTAEMIRWFHLPLLSDQSLNDISKLAHHYPVEFLLAWLEKNGEGQTYSFGDLTEAWLGAVRLIFRDWRPDVSSVSRIFTGLSTDTDHTEVLANVSQLLLRVDPRLLFKMLSVWTNEQPDRSSALEKLKKLRLQIAEARIDTEYAAKFQTLLTESSKEWGVDTDFIEKVIIKDAIRSARGEALDRRDEMNISLAISSETLRRLLAISLIKLIA
ncbi:MAG: hypothetical protein L0220_10610 [Acidobacteria bacterium]|nr:hypothetical protein [Acidobacteriota bacterium]